MKRDKKSKKTFPEWGYVVLGIGLQLGLAIMCWISEVYEASHGYNLMPNVVFYNILHDLKYLFR